ncbi:MAG: DUF5011 domain-containing protein, partial [Synergistaceae bacterium]|nr:DUF5011 domain-containing protein [Synergistaceae bacterium]
TSNVNTSRAGTYQVTYSVTNSEGLSASVTREVRVLAPNERRMPRVPHSFTVNGKANASATHTIVAEVDGIMTLTVTLANKTAARVVVSGTSGQVFNQVFSGNGSRDISLKAGTYSITGTITEGNGNTNFTMALLMPEVLTMTFAQPEIPLAAAPFAPSEDTSHMIFIYILIGTSTILLGLLVLVYIKYRREKGKFIK